MAKQLAFLVQNATSLCKKFDHNVSFYENGYFSPKIDPDRENK
jgi:hypothetical protein